VSPCGWQRPERLGTARRLQGMRLRLIALPCDRGEDEKGAADKSEN
jgi:hypothetical protein